jgi:DNA-binding NarL/FixJ family response regulator
MTSSTKINSPELITIMIAEDHPVMLKALATNISECSQKVNVIGLAKNGAVLMDLVKKRLPDMVILDIEMPIMDGFEVLELFKRDYPSIKTIIYSNTYSDYNVARAVLNGAAAYINKMSGDIDELINTIEKVREFGYHFNAKVAKELILMLHEQKKIYYLIENEKITEREIELLRLICAGKQIKQIAADMGISRGMVKLHKGNLLEKTESQTTVDLIIYAIRQGIFNLSEKK